MFSVKFTLTIVFYPKSKDKTRITFTPVYSFPLLDANYNLIDTERRVYGDEIVIELENTSSNTSLEPIFGSLDGDTLEVEGSNQLIFAGAENDLIDTTASEGDNRVYGQSGDDTFILGEGDRLFGGEGDDNFFVLSDGDNILTGGSGEDQFWIATAEIPDVANIITDFTSGEDVLGIAGLGIGFADLSITQQDADTLISRADNSLAKLLGISANSLTAANFEFA